jgi:hypothetical protein
MISTDNIYAISEARSDATIPIGGEEGEGHSLWREFRLIFA